MLEVRVLGEVELRVGDRPINLGPLKQRTVLAALVMDAGRHVAVTTLIDRVWDAPAPMEARNALYTYIMRIRRILSSAQPDGGGVILSREPGGYSIRIPAEAVDVHRLRSRADHARRLTGDGPDRTALLNEAVGLWRGEPLADLPGAWAARVRQGLRQQLLGVLADWASAELAAGRPGLVADRLSRELAQSPLAEPLISSLMRALCMDGRRAEALEQYARSRQHIQDELGVEPGPELRALHQEILRGTAAAPAVRPPSTIEPAARRPEPAPRVAAGQSGCHLPADLPDHTGFEPEIARASAALSGVGDPDAPRPVVVLSGQGGIGKTSLSIHLAHLLRCHYPDGQIFVSLNGGRVRLAEVLGRVLRALGVATTPRPATVDDLLAQYRAEISHRRILLVLDDAGGSDDIRPLVPGVPGTAMIVSTRARLTTIAGAELIELRLLTEPTSLTLLGRIVGTDRLATDASAAAALVRACDGLPLAIRIVGARLTARPHWPVARLAQRLADERRRLDEMATDGLAVRISVAAGYEGLAPAARVLFHRLGFLGVPEFAPWLVAALLDTTADVAEDLLENLVDVRLVEVTENAARSTVRYRMHDLVRLFAYERAVEEKAEETLRRAVARVVEVAGDLVDQVGEHLPYALPQLRRRPIRAADPSILDDVSGQPGWLEVEAYCLIRVVERAATLGLADVACVLANALGFSLFAIHNDFSSWNRVHVAALAAARAEHDRAAEAVVVCGIALLRYKQDRFAESERNFETAVTLFDAAGDRHGAAAARSGLGNLFRTLGRHQNAVPLLETALATFERTGDRAAAAQAAYGLGYAYRELGQDPLSIRFLQRSAVLYRTLRHWRGEAIAVRGVGLVHRARSDLAEAETWLARAHDLVLGHGDRQLACYTAQSLAKLWIRQGDVERAREPLTSGVATCRALHDRFGEALLMRTVGELHLAAGHPAAALRDLEAARTFWRTLGHELGVARTLRDIGAAHASAGDCPAAHEAWRSAWSTFARLGTREATELAAWRTRSGCRCDAGLVAIGQQAHSGR